MTPSIGAALVLLFLTLLHTSCAQPSVYTGLGKINGVNCAAKNAFTYAGIPYAVPPVGPLRFKAPLPYSTQYPSGGLDASKTGAVCFQIGAAPPIASEDCLTLNVYVPAGATPGANLPVRVFLHGGGFYGGSAEALPYYNGCDSAVASNTIQVNVQYRLGFFGYLAHKATFQESGSTGAWGILDQQLALKWVKANIACFGGDPSKVLLIGQSAGAFSAWIQMALPSSRGLFSAVVFDSGAGTPLATLEQSDVIVTQPLLAATNCSNHDPSLELACLRALSASQLLAVTPFSATVIQDTITASRQYPVVDGRLITAQPTRMIAKGLGSNVPIVVGTMQNDGTLITISQYPPASLQPQDLTNFINQIAPPQYRQRISSQYSLSAYPTVFDAMSAIVTDQQFLCRAERALAAAARAGIPAYQSLFTQVTQCTFLPGAFFGLPDTPPAALLGATHGIDVPFIFGWDALLLSGQCSLSPAEMALSQLLMTSYASLARIGVPTFPNGTAWPAWSASTLRGLTLNAAGVTITRFDNAAKCSVWDAVDAYYEGQGGDGNSQGENENDKK